MRNTKRFNVFQNIMSPIKVSIANFFEYHFHLSFDVVDVPAGILQIDDLSGELLKHSGRISQRNEKWTDFSTTSTPSVGR